MFHFGRQRSKKILFIFGCQRSGTNITLDTLGKLPNTIHFPEVNSPMTDLDKTELPKQTIRLNPLDNVARKVRRLRHDNVVIKPLVESQSAAEILDYFPNSKGLWMYRHYRDVVSSMIAKWTAERGLEEVDEILSRDPANWRADKISGELRETVQTAASKGITGADGWGLLWYTRNAHFFRQRLQERDDIALVRYRTLVENRDEFDAVMEHLDRSELKFGNLWPYNANSLNTGSTISFSPHIIALLDEMMFKLDVNAFSADRSTAGVPTSRRYHIEPEFRRLERGEPGDQGRGIPAEARLPGRSDIGKAPRLKD